MIFNFHLKLPNFVLSQQGTQATIEQWEEKTPKASFSPPLCTLKLISYEVIAFFFSA
jgi:hypothetical protein